MRTNPVKQAWRAGNSALNGWLAIGAGYSAEVVGHQGFDAVTVDLQHGMIGFDQAVAMLQPALRMARVPANTPAEIMHLLDAGAYGIICPMISTAAEARAFVAACTYVPAGTRSYGPARGLLYGGADYFAGANDEIIKLAMIKTNEGLANLEAILAVEGLDGIYVGPNDLCLALGVAPAPESDAPLFVAAIAKILNQVRQSGKVAGIFCSSGTAAAMRIVQGFRLVTPGSDVTLLSAAVADARKAWS
jgi:4-hydroxy-2-oxoheptanedioate aldolase